jgi:hypothetical protein
MRRSSLRDFAARAEFAVAALRAIAADGRVRREIPELDLMKMSTDLVMTSGAL